MDSRISKFTYGTEVVWGYDASDIEHIKRGPSIHPATGRHIVYGGIDVIVKKVCSELYLDGKSLNLSMPGPGRQAQRHLQNQPDNELRIERESETC